MRLEQGDRYFFHFQQEILQRCTAKSQNSQSRKNGTVNTEAEWILNSIRIQIEVALHLASYFERQ